MNIFRIELNGPIKKGEYIPDAFATIYRLVGDNYITIELCLADGKQKSHSVRADRPDDVLSIAVLLQETLDGHQGTNSMVHEYYRILEYFMD